MAVLFFDSIPCRRQFHSVVESLSSPLYRAGSFRHNPLAYLTEQLQWCLGLTSSHWVGFQTDVISNTCILDSSQP